MRSFVVSMLLLAATSAHAELAVPAEVIQRAEDACAGRADPWDCQQSFLGDWADPVRREREREGRRIADQLLKMICKPAEAEKFDECVDRAISNHPERFRDAARVVAAADNEARWEALEQQRIDRAVAVCRKAGIKSGTVRIGMTMRQVRDCGWGRPDDVNRTSTARYVHEQWVYPSSYLYFENGILTAIQN